MAEVSAALIFQNGKLLITQRHKNSHLGGFWEFPGGKREPGETFEQCLAREIREELGVVISIGGLFDEITHAYPGKTVRLKFSICRLIRGNPKAIGCSAIKWARKHELDGFKFSDADAKLLLKLKERPELFRQIRP